ncbi:MAG: PhzF family phenazine biosynthesis protein [Candidatus Bathyarchaeia archaeon]
MRSLEFCLLDVFAEEKYAGNQLAVFRNARALSKVQMQKIANEMHFSETTFILSDEERDGGYDVRIFTPANELPFAGHPTLGTAYVIRHHVLNRTVKKVLLNLKVGQIPVTFEKDTAGNEILWMKQIPPAFGETFDAVGISEALCLEVKDVDSRFPIQEVSTGTPFTIVPLKSLEAVKRARVNRERHEKLTKAAQTGILVFSPETYEKENDLNVRVFVDLFGIPEDPATGSGNGCLAGYLSRYRYFGSDIVDIRVEQGCEIRRPSLLRLKARKRLNEIQVHVGGKVVMVANGELV